MPLFHPGLTIGGLYCHLLLPILSFFFPLCWESCGLFSRRKISCLSCGWKYMDLLLTIYTNVWVGLHYLIGIKQKNAYLHGNSIHWSLEMKGHNYWQAWHHFLFPVDVFTEPEYTLTHIPLCVCSEWLCIGMPGESQTFLRNANIFILFFWMNLYIILSGSPCSRTSLCAVL